MKHSLLFQGATQIGPARPAHTLRSPPRYGIALLALVLAWIVPGALHASPPGDTIPPARQRSADFLFHTPYVTLGLHGGVSFLRGGGDVLGDAMDIFTLGHRDFYAGTFGADVGIWINSQLDAVLGLSYARSSKRSEYRDYVGTDNLPIQQTTSLSRVPLTASLRYYLLPRGRSVGRFAWVPSAVVPYVGGGGGWVYYSFRQVGEFVDYQTLDIVNDRLHSSGWTPTAQVFAGVDYSLGRRAVLSAEARYDWASATPSRDYLGYDSIDLSGLQTTLGISWRF